MLQSSYAPCSTVQVTHRPNHPVPQKKRIMNRVWPIHGQQPVTSRQTVPSCPPSYGGCTYAGCLRGVDDDDKVPPTNDSANLPSIFQLYFSCGGGD